MTPNPFKTPMEQRQEVADSRMDDYDRWAARPNVRADELLCVKNLASELRRAPSYVFAMKRRGFKMPGGRATISNALKWLEKNPKPRARNNTERRGTQSS